MVFSPSDFPEEAARKALAPAFARADHLDMDEWMARVKNDTAQLWHREGYWAITEVIETKNGRIFHMVASAGSFTPFLVTEVENWARSIGCKKSITTGRRGWAKLLTDYKLKTITLEKEL